MCNSKSSRNLIQGTTETRPVVSGIHLCESKQSPLNLVNARRNLFNPVPSHSKISISIACLPRVAG